MILFRFVPISDFAKAMQNDPLFGSRLTASTVDDFEPTSPAAKWAASAKVNDRFTVKDNATEDGDLGYWEAYEGNPEPELATDSQK